MKRLVLKTTVLLTPIISLIASVNYFVDPAHLYSNAYYKQAANLLKSNNIELVGNCNERKLLTYFIPLKDKVDEIVLGSSRVMLLDKQHLKNESILNLGCSGSDLNDIIAVYGLYQKHHGVPVKVWIGIDPWMFNQNRKSDRFLSLIEDYNRIAAEIGIDVIKRQNLIDANYSELLSLDYFQNSISQFAQNGFSVPKPIITDNKNSKNKILKTNGVLVYPSDWQNKPELIEIAARKYISENDVYGLNNFTEISNSRKQQLERFINYLKNKEVSIEIFLSPYHPIVWKHFETNKKFESVKMAEDYIRAFCAEQHIPITGSFSPTLFNLNNVDFFDGMHVNEKGLKIITEANNKAPMN